MPKSRSRSIEYQKSVGKWMLDVATTIGTSVAVKAIEKAVGS
ncbi:MAG: hypothetical protein M0Z99_29225 [Betaproteobacteria bacterium]|nr:hypothetical protein [Betaproteobacteria bacterium]